MESKISFSDKLKTFQFFGWEIQNYNNRVLVLTEK